MRVELLATISRHTACGPTPPYAAALGPGSTAIRGWSCCRQASGRRHASWAGSVCDQDVGACVVKLATVELPPPHECVESKLKVSWHSERTTTNCLVHATAHAAPADIAIREGLFELWILLNPVCLGSNVREVITQTRAPADEQLHASLRADIGMVLGRPLPNKSLPRPNVGHRIG